MNPGRVLAALVIMLGLSVERSAPADTCPSICMSDDDCNACCDPTEPLCDAYECDATLAICKPKQGC